MAKTQPKRTEEYLNDVLKYAGPSVVLAGAVSKILLFFFPSIDVIEAEIALVLSFFVNMVMVVLKSKGYLYK